MISEGQFERFFELVDEHFQDTKISLNSIALQLGDITAAIQALKTQPSFQQGIMEGKNYEQ